MIEEVKAIYTLLLSSEVKYRYQPEDLLKPGMERFFDLFDMVAPEWTDLSQGHLWIAERVLEDLIAITHYEKMDSIHP
jgi:hypothetical protein